MHIFCGMSPIKSVCSFAIAFTLLTAVRVHAAPPIPKLTGPVMDDAHVLSADQQARLTDFLTNQENQTSNQIVILTVNSLDGEPVEDYAYRVAQAWKLGKKGNDNGVLVVAAIKDHKIWIEVGRGLQGVLTDAVSSEIYRNEITPRFRAGDYTGGLMAGVTAIDKAIHGEYKATGTPQAHHAVHVDAGTALFWLIILIVFLVSHLRFGRYRNHWIGPYWYGGTGGYWGGFSGGGFSGGGGGYSGGGGSFDGGGAGGSW
jgi:uncharacterized protein